MASISPEVAKKAWNEFASGLSNDQQQFILTNELEDPSLETFFVKTWDSNAFCAVTTGKQKRFSQPCSSPAVATHVGNILFRSAPFKVENFVAPKFVLSKPRTKKPACPYVMFKVFQSNVEPIKNCNSLDSLRTHAAKEFDSECFYHTVADKQHLVVMSKAPFDFGVLKSNLNQVPMKTIGKNKTYFVGVLRSSIKKYSVLAMVADEVAGKLPGVSAKKQKKIVAKVAAECTDIKNEKTINSVIKQNRRNQPRPKRTNTIPVRARIAKNMKKLDQKPQSKKRALPESWCTTGVKPTQHKRPNKRKKVNVVFDDKKNKDTDSSEMETLNEEALTQWFGEDDNPACDDGCPSPIAGSAHS